MVSPATTVAMLPPGVPSGETRINFAAHQARANTQGAREDFEVMISQLVRAVRPGARMVAANPGDWGIDVVVGDLGGTVVVWQSKYFPNAVTKSHHSEIRGSFESARKHAELHGYELKQWILCVPSSMDGPTTKWWDGWRKKKQAETGIVIELWDETELRTLLISPDADQVRRYFYEPAQAVHSEAAVVSLEVHDADKLESALFVRQLREAGHVEVETSKQQFFNAELMAREVVDKGVKSEVAALSSAGALVHGIWEDHFNDACQEHPETRLPGLHKAVMNEIRAQHAVVGSGLPGGPVHTCGLMHRVVDNRQAGWVRNWRQVAEQHGQAEQVVPHGDEPDPTPPDTP